ncbi:MAG TPA: hypothetical protein V6C88_07300 [Chroococcidiopsis sp.]
MTTQNLSSQSTFNHLADDAIAHPDAADIAKLWQLFDQLLDTIPESERLHWAGNAIAQLASICLARAEHFLVLWDERNRLNLEEPILTADMLSGVLRQSMVLSIDGLLEDPLLQHRNPRLPNFEDDESIAGIVDKAALLNVIDCVEEAESLENTIAIAHDEAVSVWITQIADYLADPARADHTCCAVPLVTLCRDINMPLTQVWLALLLSGYPIEQRGSFYDTNSLYVLKNE